MGLCHILLIERGVTSMICQCIIETWEILHRQIPLSRHTCLTEKHYGMNTSVDVYLKTAHRSDVWFAQICDQLMRHVIVWRSVFHSFPMDIQGVEKHVFFLPSSDGSPSELVEIPLSTQTKSSYFPHVGCPFFFSGAFKAGNPKNPYTSNVKTMLVIVHRFLKDGRKQQTRPPPIRDQIRWMKRLQASGAPLASSAASIISRQLWCLAVIWPRSCAHAAWSPIPRCPWWQKWWKWYVE